MKLNKLSVFKRLIALLSLGVIFFSIYQGYQVFSTKERMRQELNLDGLFINIKGVEVTTEAADLFSEKPYKSITIKIPSIASVGDDTTDPNATQQINRIIDREKLDTGFTTWLIEIFDEKVAKEYTDKIDVWYRDDKIISQTYTK